MTLFRLLPQPAQELPLRGCYLRLGLQHGDSGAPLLYANFVGSVDGRIAMPGDHGVMQVPPAIANARDWRLYQELAAQSAVMITSARYFRQLDAGCAQALLPVEGDDLRQWRLQQGMNLQPDLIILSASLDIPLAALAPFRDRAITVLTTADSDPMRRQRLEAVGVNIIVADGGAVSGTAVRQLMCQRGYRSGYVIAGCGVFRTLLLDRVVDRLFLTTHHTLLGGDCFDTLLRDSLPEPVQLRLHTLYLDSAAAQQFAHYQIL
ncbi:MAG: dihydrofolate reductase family protein [Mariprofundales bacterium]|nr:dihydrofolate reductase family protein [Mariprofundales bacterium]